MKILVVLKVVDVVSVGSEPDLCMASSISFEGELYCYHKVVMNKRIKTVESIQSE